MSAGVDYEAFKERSLWSWVLVAVCAVAVLVLALLMFAPAAPRYYVSSTDDPAKEADVGADPPAISTTTSETATQNIRIISIDRSAPPSVLGDGPDRERTGSAPDIERPLIEERAQPPQTTVETAKVWAPLQPVGQASPTNDEISPVLRPPVPHPRPRVEAIIAAAQVPIPLPRPQVSSDEPNQEPAVITDRTSAIN
jgi:hypothetical protein